MDTNLFLGVVVVIVGAISVAILRAFSRPIWRLVQRVIWQIGRWGSNKRHVREMRLNEAVVLKNGENRHRRCVDRDEEIDDREPGTYIPLGSCSRCGESVRGA